MPEPVAVVPSRDRPPPVTVTSETAEAFYNERLGGPEPVENPEAAPDAKVDAKPDPKPEETPVEEEAEHKKNPRLQKRFSELTEARKRAEALAEQTAATLRAEREAREAAERRAAELQQKYEPPKPDEIGPEPQLSQFTDTNEYAQALKEWSADKALRDKAAEEAQARETEENAKRVKAWQERQTEARKTLTDYDAKIAASNVKVSNPLRDAIIESDVGPQLLYHLSENPDVAERLNKLSTASALRELGKLEAKLGGGAEPVKVEQKPTTPVAEISKAPAPITPLKGSSAIDTVDTSKLSYQDWKKRRMAGKIK